MKAFVTSLGEPTTDLSVWSLKRNGFFVELIKDNSSLAWKLKSIYEMAEEDFLRIDADVIVNRNMTPDNLDKVKKSNKDIWWWQFVTFDWLKLDINHSISYIRQEAIPALRENIKHLQNRVRPETDISRIKEFYHPRRFETYKDELMGLHGFKGDLKRAKEIKTLRNQYELYDFEMAERLNRL